MLDGGLAPVGALSSACAVPAASSGPLVRAAVRASVATVVARRGVVVIVGSSLPPVGGLALSGSVDVRGEGRGGAHEWLPGAGTGHPRRQGGPIG